MIHGVALQPPDIQRIVHHVPPAPGLAGVLADIGAGCWEGVVLTDELNRVVAAARVDQSDVTGNIHPGGTQRHAGHGVFETAKTPVMENVLLVIVPKALQAHQDQICRVDADGAVRRFGNGLRGAFNAGQNSDFRLSVEYLCQHAGQLGKTNAAGNAFAAGLRATGDSWHQCHIHWGSSVGWRRFAVPYSALKCPTIAWACPGILTSSLLISFHAFLFRSNSIVTLKKGQ